jgi:hypothetical protein
VLRRIGWFKSETEGDETYLVVQNVLLSQRARFVFPTPIMKLQPIVLMSPSASGWWHVGPRQQEVG